MERSSIFYIFFLCCFLTVCGRMSGIYVDNGLDQTTIKKFLSKSEKRDVEREILNLLGLQSRPKAMMPAHLYQSAPKFLIEVYQNLLDGDNSNVNSEFSVSGEQKAIDESDVIMSFNSQKHHVDGLRHDGSRRLWFDVSEVAVEDMIVGAELRIYQSRKTPQHPPSPHHHPPGTGSHTVTAYQVIHDKYGEPELQYVDSINTTARHEGWLVLNMTGPMSTWVAIPNLNHGLYISITSHNHPSHEIRPEDIGVVPARGDNEHQPFMVAFFKSSGVRESRVRQTREVTTRRRKKKSQNNPEDHSFLHNPLMRAAQHWTSHSCQMQNLYVNFKDLKWQDWIIAPDGYQAFFCSGECNFPLNAHMNATNHAIVQTLVHLIKPLEVPKPCCAPNKLSAISVLYFLEDSNVILKKYRNMVVKSCGCQ